MNPTIRESRTLPAKCPVRRRGRQRGAAAALDLRSSEIHDTRNIMPQIIDSKENIHTLKSQRRNIAREVRLPTQGPQGSLA